MSPIPSRNLSEAAAPEWLRRVRGKVESLRYGEVIKRKRELKTAAVPGGHDDEFAAITRLPLGF